MKTIVTAAALIIAALFIARAAGALVDATTASLELEQGRIAAQVAE